MHTIVQGLSETSNGLIDTEIHTFGKGSIAFYGLDNNTLGGKSQHNRIFLDHFTFPKSV